MEKIKRIINGLGTYIFITWLLLIPALLVLLGLDFVFDLKFDFFTSEYSFTRIIFFIWFVIVHIGYFKTEFKDEIDKLL